MPDLTEYIPENYTFEECKAAIRKCDDTAELRRYFKYARYEKDLWVLSGIARMRHNNLCRRRGYDVAPR